MDAHGVLARGTPPGVARLGPVGARGVSPAPRGAGDGDEPRGGPVHSFEGRYHDIVPDQRIVYAYDMHLDETKISVSLATVELKPAGAGTRLIFTEQAAFLDGYNDLAGREEGTRVGLDNLDAELKREPARA